MRAYSRPWGWAGEREVLGEFLDLWRGHRGSLGLLSCWHWAHTSRHYSGRYAQVCSIMTQFRKRKSHEPTQCRTAPNLAAPRGETPALHGHHAAMGTHRASQGSWVAESCTARAARSIGGPLWSGRAVDPPMGPPQRPFTTSVRVERGSQARAQNVYSANCFESPVRSGPGPHRSHMSQLLHPYRPLAPDITRGPSG